MYTLLAKKKKNKTLFVYIVTILILGKFSVDKSVKQEIHDSCHYYNCAQMNAKPMRDVEYCL